MEFDRYGEYFTFMVLLFISSGQFADRFEDAVVPIVKLRDNHSFKTDDGQPSIMEFCSGRPQG